MNENIIICHLNLFDNNQSIYCMHENSTDLVAYVHTDNLVEELAAAAIHLNAKLVKIGGFNQFAQILAAEVQSYALTNYNKNDLKVEVI